MLGAKTHRDQIADLGWWDPDVQEKGRQGTVVVKGEEELMRKGYFAWATVSTPGWCSILGIQA